MFSSNHQYQTHTCLHSHPSHGFFFLAIVDLSLFFIWRSCCILIHEQTVFKTQQRIWQVGKNNISFLFSLMIRPLNTYIEFIENLFQFPNAVGSVLYDPIFPFKLIMWVTNIFMPLLLLPLGQLRANLFFINSLIYSIL